MDQLVSRPVLLEAVLRAKEGAWNFELEASRALKLGGLGAIETLALLVVGGGGGRHDGRGWKEREWRGERMERRKNGKERWGRGETALLLFFPQG